MSETISPLVFRRLRTVEQAALRVAASRRGGVITDRAALDALDVALQVHVPFEAIKPAYPAAYPAFTLHVLAAEIDTELVGQYGGPCGFVLIVTPPGLDPDEPIPYCMNVPRRDGQDMVHRLLKRFVVSPPRTGRSS